jgi:hypothetical protein
MAEQRSGLSNFYKKLAYDEQFIIRVTGNIDCSSVQATDLEGCGSRWSGKSNARRDIDVPYQGFTGM